MFKNTKRTKEETEEVIRFWFKELLKYDWSEYKANLNNLKINKGENKWKH